MHITRRQSKTVSLVYGGITTALLIVVAALALVFVPPSPPSIAEFAPQAQESIVEAPDQQSSQFGSGAGGSCSEGQACEGAGSKSLLGSAKKQAIERARVKRCVGDPPRQIEDPQSPPCINFWEGNNGGTTWQGVTRDEIRVAFATGPGDNPSALQNTVEFFNKRFEFYGRKIRIVTFNPAAAFGYTDSAELQRKDAVKVDEELKAFASLAYTGGAISNAPYFDELARREVIGVDTFATLRTEQENYDRFRPYQWNFLPSLDKTVRNEVEWICTSLAGKNAEYAGPAFSVSRRVFGVVVVRYASGVADPSPLVQGLKGCGASPVKVAEIAYGSTDAQFQVLAADFNQAGVTSVLCLCAGAVLEFNLMTAATERGYFPEWLLMPLWGQDLNSIAQFYPSEQRSHAIGLTSHNRVNPISERPWYWALKEMDQSFSEDSASGAIWGDLAGTFNNRYTALLLLASGIQMAGPNLTPQNFERGLFNARFSNPGAGGPPYFQARVGFGHGNHTMIQDYGLVWFDDSADAYDTSSAKGAFCYAYRGARFGAGQWPSRDHPFFDRTQPCR